MRRMGRRERRTNEQARKMSATRATLREGAIQWRDGGDGVARSMAWEGMGVARFQPMM